jgi:hypothetical protein
MMGGLINGISQTQTGITQVGVKISDIHQTQVVPVMANAEKFFVEMMTIPRLEERLKCYLIRNNFETKSRELKDALDLIRAATNECMNSKKFYGWLELVLAFGNYLNGSTPKGGAFGFKLDALAKMTDVKSPSSPGVSAMSYLVELIEKKYPELDNVHEDFKTIHDATKESLANLQGDLAKIKGEVAIVHRESENADHNLPGDKFPALLKEFDAKATDVVAALEVSGKETDEKFKKAIKFFGEQPSMDTHDFFELFIGFINAVDRTKKDIVKRKQNEEKAKKAEEADAKKKAAAAAAKANPPPAGGGEPKGVLDNLIDGMKSGEAFANKPKVGMGRGRGAGIPPANPGGKPGANVASEALAMFSKFKAKNTPS